MRAAAGLLALALFAPAVVAAQGLGDAAARERARRKPDAPAPAVFTNEDLAKRSRETPAADESGASTLTGGEETAPEAPAAEPVDPIREELDREREERSREERVWRARFTEARAAVREAEARCWQEVIRTDFRNGIPVQMKVQEFVETEEHRQAQADLESLGEEFRRTGQPPGWARE